MGGRMDSRTYLGVFGGARPPPPLGVRAWAAGGAATLMQMSEMVVDEAALLGRV